MKYNVSLIKSRVNVKYFPLTHRHGFIDGTVLIES